MSNVKLQGNVSGTGSVTITSPNTNSDRTITLPDSSGTFVVDGASQSPTFNAVTTTTLSVAGNNISAVNGMGFRNRIINGGMVIDQRNAGASVSISSTGSTYAVDRWMNQQTVSGKQTIQQNQGSVAPPVGFTNYQGTTTTAAYSVTASDFFLLSQCIEANNFADFGWGGSNAAPATMSFWVRSSLTGTFGGALENGTDRSFPFSFTINSANTWEYKTIFISAPAAGGTWGTGNGIGVFVRFSLGTGSTYSGTAGAWSSSRYFSATGATSVVGTNGATFYITGVQLEAGSVASPFERRDYGRELIMCQRYFELGAPKVWANGTYALGAYQNTGQTTVYFKVDKRAAPTMTINNFSNVDNCTSASINATGAASTGQSFVVTLGINSFTNYPYCLAVVNFSASAEL